MIYGHIAIAIIHILVGYFDTIGNNNAVVVLICVFLFVFENSSGPLAWLYAAETVVDVALGLCYFTLWGTVLILSMVCPVLMGPNSIGTSNVFFIFGGISFIAAIYVYFFIKET